MATNDTATEKLSGVVRVLRLFSMSRTLFALLGLAVVLALGWSVPGDSLLPRPAVWTDTWETQADSISAGTIQPGFESASAREQRAVTEFISKRYRVAQDAIADYVATAYRAGSEWKVDPLLILAVMAIESRYNPVAESTMGAKGLMQVIAKFHGEKLPKQGGEAALLEPSVNIQIGAQILREYLHRFGETETALQMYAGAFDEPTSSYAFKVLAERARLEQMVKKNRRPASA